MLRIEPLGSTTLDEAAILVAREHEVARAERPVLPAAYTDAAHCRGALSGLLADGFQGVIAYQDDRCVGVMCGRTFPPVAFFPAHGFAADPDLPDPTPIVGRLFATLAPRFLDAGAVRYTIDQVDLTPLGEALANLTFGRGSLFATQPARAVDPVPGVDIRIGGAGDLDRIAVLSHVEFRHRSTPPIYAAPEHRTLDDTRAHHARLLDQGAVHLLARLDGEDVGLVTVELTSPAPRLCPDGQPYIGPTATLPAARSQGVGRALVHAALRWAHHHGHATVSVDFEPSNPLSRPFWLGLGFQPTGYRARRTIDATYTGPSPAR